MGAIEQLKQQLADLDEKRKGLEAQLGESLYEASKSNPALRVGHEPLFEAIDAIDASMAKINEEEERIKSEEEAKAKKAAEG